MQNMWTDNSSTAYSSAEAVKQERIFMIYCCYISKGYKVNNVITFSCPCLWAATNCIWQWPSLPPSLDWETLSVTTFPAAENTLSDFELAAGTGKTILTRCERSVKYTLQLSWFTLPKTRPEPDPEPGLLTITRPEPDPKSKSAIRQALLKTFRPWRCLFKRPRW